MIVPPIVHLAKYPALWFIRIYQSTLSFDHGPIRHLFPGGYCRFHPTCSEYGYQCIDHHGLIRGGMLTLWRVLRCNPWSKGGNDEVPGVDVTKLQKLQNYGITENTEIK